MIVEHGRPDFDSHHRFKHFKMADGEILAKYIVWKLCMIGLEGGDGPAARGAGVDIERKGNPGIFVDQLNAVEIWQKLSEPGQVLAKA